METKTKFGWPERQLLELHACRVRLEHMEYCQGPGCELCVSNIQLMPRISHGNARRIADVIRARYAEYFDD